MKTYSGISIAVKTVLMDMEFYNTIYDLMDTAIMNTSAVK